MENLDDEEIQRLIELQIKEDKLFVNAGQNNDAQFYSLLFKELENNPVNVADSALADNLVRQLEWKQEKLERIYYRLVITIALLMILSLTFAGIATLNVGHAKTIIQFLTVHKENVLLIVIIFISIRLMDGYIVKMKSDKNVDEIRVSS